ncbi:MAG: hypothetical protein F4X56_09445 [Gammaproteobacteria bacterium]|nr:hypothetical protein [Gammaproteobacteria bacterium]
MIQLHRFNRDLNPPTRTLSQTAIDLKRDKTGLSSPGRKQFFHLDERIMSYSCPGKRNLIAPSSINRKHEMIKIIPVHNKLHGLYLTRLNLGL